MKQCVGEEHSSVHQSSSSCTLSTQQSLHYFTAASRESILSLFLCCLSYSSASHVGQETVMVLVSLCHHQKCISVSLVGLAFWFFICIIWVQRQWIKGLVIYKQKHSKQKKKLCIIKNSGAVLCVIALLSIGGCSFFHSWSFCCCFPPFFLWFHFTPSPVSSTPLSLSWPVWYCKYMEHVECPPLKFTHPMQSAAFRFNGSRDRAQALPWNHFPAAKTHFSGVSSSPAQSENRNTQDSQGRGRDKMASNWKSFGLGVLERNPFWEGGNPLLERRRWHGLEIP